MTNTEIKLKEAIKDILMALDFYAEAEWNDDYPGGIKYTDMVTGEECLDTGQLARSTVKKYKRLAK